MGRDLGEHTGRGSAPPRPRRSTSANTGSSLQERNDQYHRKSALYPQNVQQQGQAVNQIGSIASETNARMVNHRGAGA